MKIFGTLVAAILLFISLTGVAGFDDKTHWFIVPYALFAIICFYVPKLTPLRVHVVWLLLSLVVWQQMHRLNENEKWNSKRLYTSLIECQQAAKAKTEADPTK